MKYALMLSIAFMMVAGSARAQDPLGPPEDPPPEIGAPDMGPPPAPGALHDERPQEPFLDRWLDRLKEKDPEEYARLQKLRDTSPEEFRQALHEKLAQEKMRFRSGNGRHGRPPMNPEIMQLEKEALDISKTYRQTTDEGQKEQICKELRQKIEVLFDVREKERQEHIRRIEADLANLKQSVDQRQKNREQIIDRRLQELTGEDGLRW